MIKHGYEDINLDDPLKGKLDKLIDYFVEFYGEKYRKNIEERINNTQFIFISPSSDYGIDDINKHFDDLLSNANSHEDKEYLKSEEKRLNDLYYSSPVKVANKLYNDKKNKVVTDYIISKMGIENTEQNAKKISRFVPSFVEFALADKKQLTNSEWNFNTFMLGYFAVLAGELNDSKITKVGQEKILSLMGDEVEIIAKEYKKIEDEKFDKILDDENCQNLLQGILNSNVIGIKGNVEFIKNFMLNESEVAGGQFTSVDPKNPTVPVSLCMISKPMDLADSVFVHEVNHIVSAGSSLISGHHEVRCGFSRLQTLILDNGDLIDLTGRSGWQRFEALNEVVNDYISEKIFNRMEEDGFKVGFLDKETTIYSSIFPVVEMLLEEHMDKLKETYITGKNVFAEKIGENNFNHLADAVSEMLQFCKSYDKFQRAYKIVKDKQEKGGYFDIFEVAYDKSIDWQDEQVETYLKSVRKIDEIISDIDDYIASSEESDLEDIDIENE